MNRLAQAIFLAYLASFAFEGPLRYVLASAGLGSVLYLRDAAAAGLVGLVIANGYLTRRWLEPVPLVLLSLLGLHFVIGVVGGGPISQTLFGLKIFLPLVFAATAFALMRDAQARIAAAMRLILALSLLGILANWLLGPMPWEGMAYDTGFGQTVEATRQWWTFDGAARLPGFARTSFDAAITVGLSGMWVLLTTASVPMFVAVSAACLFAIYLTTTKGMLMAFGMLLVWFGANRLQGPGPAGRASWLFLVMCVLAVAAPALVVGYDVQELLGARDAPVYLLSLLERFNDMWPRAIGLMTSPASPIVGQGLGTIGAAQDFIGEGPPLLNAADNIFIYVYVTFGLLGVGYLLALAARVHACRDRQDDWAAFRPAVMVMTFTYGLTTNVVESAFFLAFVGLVVGDAFWSKTDRVVRAPRERDIGHSRVEPALTQCSSRLRRPKLR